MDILTPEDAVQSVYDGRLWRVSVLKDGCWRWVKNGVGAHRWWKSKERAERFAEQLRHNPAMLNAVREET